MKKQLSKTKVLNQLKKIEAQFSKFEEVCANIEGEQMRRDNFWYYCCRISELIEGIEIDIAHFPSLKTCATVLRRTKKAGLKK